MTEFSTEPPAKRRRLSADSTKTTDADVSIPASVMSLADQSSLAEAEKQYEVGIREYVNSSISHIQGTLKTRYSDFLVFEMMLPDGEVVHLRNTRPPKLNVSRNDVDSNGNSEQVEEIPTAQPSEKMSEPPDESINGLPEVSDSDREKLVGYLNETAVTELMNLYQTIRANPGKKSSEYPLVRSDFTADRSVRSQVHQSIREIFKSSVDSSTDHDGVLILTAAKLVNPRKQGKSRNGPQFKNQRPGKLGWMDRGGEYLHFTLTKENKDTMEVVSWLTRQLKCNPKNFQFAGTKDRRAVTTQRCSAYRIEAERLAAQNRNLRGSKVGDFEYRAHGLELGDLSGNEFVITLRDVQLNPLNAGDCDLSDVQADMQRRMQSLHDHGYLNYYGLQRFGTFSVRTDVIGRHILQENYQAACDAILSYSEQSAEAAEQDTDSKISQDDRNRAQAIQKWRSDNRANAALDILPRKFSAEAQIIRHLSKHPTDPMGALMTIQRNLRLMYVHAYQSYIWNMAASNRIKTHGTKVIKGDLVLINEHKDKEQPTEQDANTTTDADGEQIIVPATHDRAAQDHEVFERARPLTETEASSGQYTIFDIVLPQPGFDILYPDNDSGTFYESFMSSPEGGNLDPYNMRRKQRDFSLSGSYRKLLGRIGPDFQVSAHKYTRDEEQFVQTDLEILGEARHQHNKQPPEDLVTTDGNDLDQHPPREQDDQGNSKAKASKIAVVLKFQLKSSQYATMVLRELSRNGISQHKPDFGGGR